MVWLFAGIIVLVLVFIAIMYAIRFATWALPYVTIAIIAVAAVWGFKYNVLHFLPAAGADVVVTMDNYDSYGIIVREYENVSKNKYTRSWIDVIEGTRYVKIDGKFSVRSDGRTVFLINTADDAKFSNGENIFRKEVQDMHWAMMSCRNNAKGCSVSVYAKYTYKNLNLDNPTELMPYSYELVYRK